MGLLLVLFLCVGLVQIHSSRWANHWLGEIDFSCPDNSYITAMKSIHNNKNEDRRWDFTCDGTGIGRDCTSTRRPVNKIRGDVMYICPYDMVLTGMKAEHTMTKQYDRYYRFRCCSAQPRTLGYCELTDFVSPPDKKMKFTVPENYAIKGAFSVYRAKYSDRIWRFYICKINA